jgi:hypothetical protein
MFESAVRGGKGPDAAEPWEIKGNHRPTTPAPDALATKAGAVLPA